MKPDPSQKFLQLGTQGYRILRERGVRDFISEGQAFAREAALREYHRLTGRTRQGEPIYDADWDLFIILDACRPDILREVAGDYPFIRTVDDTRSVGSYSLAWMERTFTDEYADAMAETIHVTGNPFSETALDPNVFRELDEVWRYAWDDDVGTIHPRPLTDRAITLARQHRPERLLVHYMQPHAPFTTHPELQQGPKAEEWVSGANKSIWTSVQEGKVPLETVKGAYRDELRHVLDDVELLLQNIDSDKAIISADHGEAMGEYGLYGHARGVAIDALRVVPWIETEGTDTGDYEPEQYNTERDSDQTDRLRDLGYM